MGVAIATASWQPLAALCSFLPPPPSLLQDAGRGPTRKEARGQVRFCRAAPAGRPCQPRGTALAFLHIWKWAKEAARCLGKGLGQPCPAAHR